MRKKNIILTGFMGTGKTVTARIVAEKTGFPLVDMDALIEERQERTISEIFAQDGEEAFRKIERELVRELSQRDGLVISTGGGVVLNPENTADFQQSGLVVCLSASPETIFRRLRNDASRPLLSGEKKEQIAELLARRKPVYDSIPHQIDADRLDPDQRAEAVVSLYSLENKTTGEGS